VGVFHRPVRRSLLASGPWFVSDPRVPLRDDLRAVSTDRGARVPSANDLDSLISPRAEADDREVLIVGPGAKLTSAFNCRESLPVGQREVLVGPLTSDLPGSEVILVVELLAGTGRVLCAALIAASPVSGLVAAVVTSSACLCSEPIVFSSQVNPLQTSKLKDLSPSNRTLDGLSRLSGPRRLQAVLLTIILAEDEGIRCASRSRVRVPSSSAAPSRQSALAGP
jgi:hypothetical protein